jgi:hypothetical protein
MSIYVIIFQHSGQIADNMFFSSEEEAWEYKKTMIAEGHCRNPISRYDVIRLKASK